MIWQDYETYCELDLTKVGLYKYLEHPSFEIICMAWAENEDPPQIWLPGQTWPFDISNTIAAHNAEFELRVTQKIGHAVRPSQYIDTMALAGWFGYPLGLGGFASAIGAPIKKDPRGKRLINKLSKPRKPSKNNPATRWTFETAKQDYLDMYEYAKGDIISMREAVHRLPIQELTHEELVVWAHTIERNRRGLHIDVELVKKLLNHLSTYKKILEKELFTITRGQVKTGKQLAKIQEFLLSCGVDLPNLRKETVDEALTYAGGTAKRVLELRKALAHSSIAKFQKMIEMVCEDGTVKGNEQYYGAHTGRFAGRGIQIHNLPRAKFKKPEDAIFDVMNNDTEYLMDMYGDLNGVAKKLIRPSIIPPEGYDLIVGDFSSIENRVLHWSAEDVQTTTEFSKGLDQYKTFAADRFQVLYEEVTPEQRQFCKPCVLGLGYGAAAKALVAYAATFGINMREIDAQLEVDFYRRKYRKVVQFWYKIHDACVIAIDSGSEEHVRIWGSHLKFIFAGGYLFITLPSGRFLSYPGARLVPGYKGRQQIQYLGIDPYTRKWGYRKIHPGLLAENTTSAISRDLLTHGMLNTEKAGFWMTGSVHDEGISLVREGERSVDEFCEYLCLKPEWAKGLPLSADGYRAKRYKKD